MSLWGPSPRQPSHNEEQANNNSVVGHGNVVFKRKPLPSENDENNNDTVEPIITERRPLGQESGNEPSVVGHENVVFKRKPLPSENDENNVHEHVSGHNVAIWRPLGEECGHVQPFRMQ